MHTKCTLNPHSNLHGNPPRDSGRQPGRAAMLSGRQPSLASRSFGWLSGAAAALALVVFSPPAPAQEGGASALLDEIVTVARKRSGAESVQEVPIALSAFGEQQLDALFVTRLDDLGHLMPNVQLETVGTFPGVQSFSIRGQGINSSIPSVDPTVGVFYDGIYMGTTFGVVTDTFDLEAIEVLRGPQGLLFGRNVTGGAVLLRSRRPSDEFALRLRTGATDSGAFTVAGAVEGSLLDDRLAGKLAVHYTDDSGYFDNVNPDQPIPAPFPGPLTYSEAATGGEVGAMESRFIRPTLVFTPNDRQEWTLIIETGEMIGDGAVWANVDDQNGGALATFQTTGDEVGFTDIAWQQVTLETGIDAIGNGTLTNLFGYRNTTVESVVDIDGTWLPVFSASGNSEAEQISNELRWSGNFADNWATTLGVYYFQQDLLYNEGRYVRPGGGLPPPAREVTLALGGSMDAENFGIFWNNDFHLGDDFSVQAGLRYTNESKSAQIYTAPCFDVATFQCATDDLQGDWSNVTPKIGFTHNLGDSARIYAYWSKGFRSGGFNFRNARPDVLPPGPTREEESNMIEVGMKSELYDGNVRFNIAAYHNEITDIQRELNVPDPIVVVLQGTINAGDVVIKGLEMDLAALIGENFSLNLAVGLQDGRYTRVDPIVDVIAAGLMLVDPTTGRQLVLGSELPRLAPSNGSLGFSWDLPLVAGVLNIAAQASWREANFYNDSNTEKFPLQERHNASVTWTSPEGQWRISAYGKNLGNQQNYGNLTNIGGLFTAGPMQPGRILGLQVDWQH